MNKRELIIDMAEGLIERCRESQIDLTGYLMSRANEKKHMYLVGSEMMELPEGFRVGLPAIFRDSSG